MRGEADVAVRADDVQQNAWRFGMRRRGVECPGLDLRGSGSGESK